MHASMSNMCNLASPKPLPRRVGRTARAGRHGWSLSFVTQYDIELVQQIEVGVGLGAPSFLARLSGQLHGMAIGHLQPCIQASFLGLWRPSLSPVPHAYCPPQALIGQQLDKYELEEAEVLKGITKVRPVRFLIAISSPLPTIQRSQGHQKDEPSAFWPTPLNLQPATQ